MSSPTSSPSPWQRGPNDQGAPPPRIHHSVDSTWVTESDAVLQQKAAPRWETLAQEPTALRSRSSWTCMRLKMRRAMTPQWVGRVQGVVYLCMAMWPLSNMRSFQQFTGPKYDVWSMQSMAGLLAVVGTVLLLTSWREVPNRTTVLLGGGVATVLGMLDLAFLGMGQIQSVYWLDVFLESAMAMWWIAAYAQRHPRSPLDSGLAPRPGRPLYYH